MTKIPFALAACLTAFTAAAADYTLHTFKKQHLEKYYWSEGAMFGDLNKDGKPDAVFGPYWWEGPGFTKRHEIYPPTTTFKVKQDDGTEQTLPGFEGVFGKKNSYSSDNFFAFIYDFNGDGWNDVLTYGLPGTPAYLYLNPQGKEQAWARHQVFDEVDNESPTFADLTGDGKPEIVCNFKGNFGYATPDWKDVTKKWAFHAISENGNSGRFTHGLGLGDLNGDGRLDMIDAGGWWEHPATLAGDPVWKRHRYSFAATGAQMYAYDVNGDGLADVITAMAAHGYGLAWHEQLKEKAANGEPQFKSHIFMNKEPSENRYGVVFTQLHAVELVDVDGDGLKDIVTGKCFWAHGPTGDPDPNAPAVIYWFKLVRHADKSVDWVPQLIDNDSGVGRQIGVMDVNGDRRPDFIIGNKKGAFAFINQAKKVSKEEWEKAQPAVKFADAGKKDLKASDVVVRTGTPSTAPANSAEVTANPHLPGNGVLPVGKDGKPLNTDFETGTLKDWTATGAAFNKQPILGDTVVKRRAPMPSAHAGKYWIGTFEVANSDDPIGTLTSAPFKVTHPWAAFLIAAGPYETTGVELVNNADQKVIFKVSGGDGEQFKVSNNSTETLAPVVVDLQAHQGKEIFIRVLDQQAGGHWGHINFDDFKFYTQKPTFANALNPNQKSLPAVAPAAPDQPRADNVKFNGLTPEEAVKAITLPPGFKATLFAGEPDVKQPIAFCIDDRGRLWVVENYTYPIRQPEGKGTDRILVFEDADGDGKFDKRTVFYEGLNMASAIEYGFGGVWVGAAPHLLFIPVKEGDEPKPAGEPKILLEGWGYQDTHETLNTFTWGPDGWLYGCHGVFTHSHVKVAGAPDSERQFINAGVWRYHPTKKRFEVFAEGTSNPWGLDFDERGQLFIEACVIPHLFHMIQGARYQRQGGQHYTPSREETQRLVPDYYAQDFAKPGKQPFNPFIYDDIKTIADHAHYAGSKGPHAGNGRSDVMGGGHAHAGLMVYLGGSWPAEYRGKLFMNNIHGQRINMDVPVRKGSGFVGKHGADFMNFNDRSSQILNLQYDQDGSVYMIDWYDKQQCHDQRNPNAHDRSNGRIFKITYGDTKTTKVNLQKASDEQLVGFVTSKNEWHSRHARRILEERALAGRLAQRADSSIKPYEPYMALERLVRGDADVLKRLRALWALHRRASGEQLLELMADKEEWMRAWAIQFAVENGARDSVLAELAVLAKQDPSPVVRLYLASACQRLSVADRAPIVEALLAHAEDKDDHNLPLMYWYAAEPIVGSDTTKAVTLLAKTKIPILREYITRRMTAGKGAQAEK